LTIIGGEKSQLKQMNSGCPQGVGPTVVWSGILKKD
jgi:hypothetical protein